MNIKEKTKKSGLFLFELGEKKMEKENGKKLYWLLLVAQFGAGLGCFGAKFYFAAFIWCLVAIITVCNLICFHKKY